MPSRGTLHARASLVVGLAFLLPTHALFAQKLHPNRPTVRIERTKDPGFQKLVSNDWVSVTRLEVAANQSTSVDQHAHDYLIISLNGARLEAVGSANSLDLEMDSGEMQVMKGGWPHQLKNNTDETSQLLEVEIFKGIEPERATCGLGNRTCTDGEFRKTEKGSYSTSTLFETPTVKLKKVYISPGGSVPRHKHPGGDVMIALTPLTLAADFGDSTELQLVSGQVRWLQPGADHGLRNVGGEEARFLELELK